MTIVTALGVEGLVNVSTFGDQVQARGAALANGQYVVVWVNYVTPGQLTPANTANADIVARLFNADGTPAGSEFIVNTITAGGQVFCNATTLSDGHFLVTWNNGAGTVLGGAGAPIATARGQEYTAAGVAVGDEFQIGAAGVETLLVASSGLAGGGFVSTWQQGGSGGPVVAQIYNSSNVAIGGQIIVDNTSLPPITGSSVRTLANGNFVVAWNNATTGFGPLTSMRVYTAAGVPVGSQIDASFNAPNGGNFSSLVALTGGGWALGAVEYEGGLAHLRIYAYDAGGVLVDYRDISQQPISGGSNPQGLALTALANGGVAATWVDNNPSDGSGTSIRLAVFGPNGDQIENTVTVNTTTAGNQITPTMLTLSTGDFVALWTDGSATGGDTSGTGIRQQLFDVNPFNFPPTAIADRFVALAGDVILASALTDNDLDHDADILIVTAIANVTGGTVAFDFANQTFTVTRPAGSNAPVEFDYTVSDGGVPTATAHATLLASRTDNVTLRGNTPPIDFLANDYLVPRADGYSYSAMVVSGNGGTQPPLILQTPNGPRINFSPLNVPNYFNLAVGQSLFVDIIYTVGNPVTGLDEYSDIIHVTLQGWAQTGSTARDDLAGGALADHLIGGSGAANELIGGAGDDWYTSSAIGDTIFELANEGLDTVRAQGLASFGLPANVENLQAIGATGSFTGIGNALNNYIIGAQFADVLSGGAGDDRLQGGNGAANELIGGIGNDTYIVSVAGDTIVEFTNEGIDTVQTALAFYTLRANVENLIYSGTGSFSGTGNSADNVITGGASVAGELAGLGGNDTYVIRNIGDTIVEAAGGGTDTVQTGLSLYVLNAANVENLTYTGAGSFTGVGNALNNAITGGAGADFLFAGAGQDTLTGGAGADVFFFDQAVNGVDAISDFTSGNDRLFLNQTVFAHTSTFALAQGAAPLAVSANSTFLYNSATGLLSYDADGTGAGAAIAVATLSAGLTLATTDFAFYG